MTTMLVDGNNILMRAVFAVQGNQVNLSTSDGTPTAALYVFIRMLSRHIREEKPDRLVVCWDGGHSTYRTTIYPEYKAARHAKPEDEPDKPFAQAKEFLSLAGIHHVERRGWEADDLIAAYVQDLKDADEKVIILSSDKDFFQLIGDNVEQVRVSSKPPTDRWDESRVVETFGCTPAQIPLAMALAGDSGDGVPGLHRFGMKTAVKALARTEWSLEEFGKTRTDEERQMVNICYRLVDLISTPYVVLGLRLPPPPPFHPTQMQSMDWQALLDFLDRYELASVTRSLLDQSLWSDETEELIETV